jgi:hypothetical protein
MTKQLRGQGELFDASPYETGSSAAGPGPISGKPRWERTGSYPDGSRSLKMFMTGQDIKHDITGSVDSVSRRRDEWDEEGLNSMWDVKLDESTYRKVGHGADRKTLYDSIATEGVQRPVTLWHPEDGRGWGEGAMVHGDGHHRTAVAADIQAKTGREVYLPVVHDANDYMYSNESNDNWPRGRYNPWAGRQFGEAETGGWTSSTSDYGSEGRDDYGDGAVTPVSNVYGYKPVSVSSGYKGPVDSDVNRLLAEDSAINRHPASSKYNGPPAKQNPRMLGSDTKNAINDLVEGLRAPGGLVRPKAQDWGSYAGRRGPNLQARSS